MGRRKIAIQPIADERNRSVTFNKRRAGLFKKAYELGVLCGADIAVIVFSPAGKCYEYSSGNLDETLLRYSRMTVPPTERKGPEDFGGSFPAPGTAAREDDEDESDAEKGGAAAAASAKADDAQDAGSFNHALPPVSMQGAFLPPMMAAPFYAAGFQNFAGHNYPAHLLQAAHAQSLGMLPPNADGFNVMQQLPSVPSPDMNGADAGAAPGLASSLPPASRASTASVDIEKRGPRSATGHPDLSTMRRGSEPVLSSSARQGSSSNAADTFSISDLFGYPRPSGDALVDENEVFEWPTLPGTKREASASLEDDDEQAPDRKRSR